MLKLISSLRLTVVLIMTLSAVFLASLVVPQKDLVGREAYIAWSKQRPDLVGFLDALSLTEIFTAPYTLAIWALFFLNLGAVMAKRIPSVWAKCISVRLPSGRAEVEAAANCAILDGAGRDESISVLRRAGYSVTAGGDGLWAVKNRYSPLATLVFHLSFFLILIGAAVTFYTKFRAEARIGEGEIFTGAYLGLQKPKFGRVPVIPLAVADVRPVFFEGRVPVEIEVDVETPAGRRTIGINKPYADGIYSFVILDIGVAPKIKIADASGGVMLDEYRKLRLANMKMDSFDFGGYEFNMIFFPDYDAYLRGLRSGGGKPSSGSDVGLINRPEGAWDESGKKEIVDPAFYIAAFESGRLAASGNLRPGDSMAFDGNTITVEGFAYWVNFYVTGERGRPIVYAAFVLMVCALTIRFVFYRRDIYGYFERDALYIAGRSEYYPALFASEIEAIAEEIMRRRTDG